MKTINIEALTAFINQHSLSSSFETFLKEWKGSSQFNFKGFGLERIVKLSQKINDNHASKIEGNSGEGKGQLLEWKKGEYKIFVWLLAFYCFVHHLEAEELVNLKLFRAKKTMDSLLRCSSGWILFNCNSRFFASSPKNPI